jgi:uncharacterized protein YceK
VLRDTPVRAAPARHEDTRLAISSSNSPIFEPAFLAPAKRIAYILPVNWGAATLLKGCASILRREGGMTRVGQLGLVTRLKWQLESASSCLRSLLVPDLPR